MSRFTRDDLVTTLGMTLRSVESVANREVRRSAAQTMFEILLAHYHLIDLRTDKKFIQVCRDKAKDAGDDPRFTKYVHKFEELLSPPLPPLRRSARLRAQRT